MTGEYVLSSITITSGEVGIISGNALPTDANPVVGALFDDFTLAVHRHLSANPIARLRCARVRRPAVAPPTLLSWFVRL